MSTVLMYAVLKEKLEIKEEIKLPGGRLEESWELWAPALGYPAAPA